MDNYDYDDETTEEEDNGNDEGGLGLRMINGHPIPVADDYGTDDETMVDGEENAYPILPYADEESEGEQPNSEEEGGGIDYKNPPDEEPGDVQVSTGGNVHAIRRRLVNAIMRRKL